MPKRKTTADYIKDCKEKGYDLPVEDYVNAETKIKHKCARGHIYLHTPHYHMKGHRCPYCCKNAKKTSKGYYNECKAKGYDLPIEDYKNSMTKIKHKCNKCGYEYPQRPNDHLQGQGCPNCNKRKTLSLYKQEWSNLNLDSPIDNSYIDNNHKMQFTCKQGHVYSQQLNQHKFYGCPVCNESHGEKFIRNYLDNNHIQYEPQKIFNDLKDKQSLSYDFYLPDYNTLIEYQGIQHYESIQFNGKTGSDIKKQQLHDKMKKDYANKNHYKLLTLHYSLDTQDKVNKYLERRLK